MTGKKVGVCIRFAIPGHLTILRCTRQISLIPVVITNEFQSAFYKISAIDLAGYICFKGKSIALESFYGCNVSIDGIIIVLIENEVT